MRTITDKQARHAIEKKEFGADVVDESKAVVVVLTQDWCPQWHAMRDWIGRTCKEADATLFVHEYNRHDHFEEFLRLKEEVWNNREIPYVRIYRAGKLSHHTNYVSEDRFAALLKPRHPARG